MNDFIIKVNNLTKSFDRKNVVTNVSLRVKKGDIFGFLGPNGSGKTTTIRMLCGLLTPDSGSGHCLGYDILKQSAEIKAQVGYMAQKFSFYTDLTVEENLYFMARLYQLDHKKDRVCRILQEFNLSSRRKQLTGTLSGGWKQRVALAACLLHEPKLLLLDEPTAGVDPLSRREFWDKIHMLSSKGITTLVSTHYMDEAARCSYLAYLAYGHLLITGTVRDIIEKVGLYAWEIITQRPLVLLPQIKKWEYICQIIFFENRIRICAARKAPIEAQLSSLAKKESIHWYSVDVNLEEVFITLVGKTTQ